MNKKIEILLILFISSIALISFGNTSNDNTYFHPVAEIHVDELPESIMDSKYADSICKLPLVFRGAAKYWESMTWTPEFLVERGFKGIEEVMKSSDNFRKSSFHSKILEKDMHYQGTSINSIYILAGGAYRMNYFHAHDTAILSEFYGKRMVFLAEPRWKGNMDKLAQESDRIAEIASTSEQDPLINMTNDDYSGLQQVILNPGDILYIPSGWYHKVHYLTPCIGATQLIYDN